MLERGMKIIQPIFKTKLFVKGFNLANSLICKIQKVGKA